MKFKYYKNNLKILVPNNKKQGTNLNNKKLIIYILTLLKKKKQLKIYFNYLKKQNNFKTNQYLIQNIKHSVEKEKPWPAWLRNIVWKKMVGLDKRKRKKKTYNHTLVTKITKNNVFTNLIKNSNKKKTIFSNSIGIPSNALTDKEYKSKLFYIFLVQDVIKKARKLKRIKFLDCFNHKIITKGNKKNFKENFILTSTRYFKIQLTSVSKITKLAHNGCKLSKRKKRRLKKKKIKFKLTKKYSH